MFDGQYLFSGDAVYSPWMQRSADYTRVTLEAIELSAQTVGAVQLFHKNTEDVGPGTAVSTDLVRALSVGITSGYYEGLKELVRYRFSCLGPSTDDYMLFRMHSPVWFNAVAVPDV